MLTRQKVAVLLLPAFLVANFAFIPLNTETAHAASLKDQIEELNGEVKVKRERVDEFDNLIGSYQKKIKQQESQEITLKNEILLLDNRVREKELRAERAKAEIEAINVEIQTLDELLKGQEDRIKIQRDLLTALIRRMHQADEVSTIDVFLTRPSLSSFFDSIEKIKRLERNLGDSVDDLKSTKSRLEETKSARDERRENLLTQEKTLRAEQSHILEEQNFKTSLVAQTKEDQEEFQKIMYELRQQQQQAADEIARLEIQLKNKLDNVDQALARGDVLLNWPVNPARGITAVFHDQDYPFRHLFEHPGTDVRASVGTPVRAAAGGYVAWNKQGKMYGYYTMIIHPGGIATVYAHLSSFVAQPDTYVERGQVIGYSGGMPGQAGAGLSTGPHLHFEVRQGGIPVNPENYLPSARIAVY
ncbi:MAG: peptidoglycan DD-metalloendopeptidase family protein [Patescibacteria group bacterium]|nr:peptidoglycan DD-metalloendopeptidase family protein [Patescibacteria group bacterium]